MCQWTRVLSCAILMTLVGLAAAGAEPPAAAGKLAVRETDVAESPGDISFKAVATPDAAHFAVRAPGRDFVVDFVVTDDGRRSKAYHDIFDLALSPDGKRLAFSARKVKKLFVVLDGQEGKEYDAIDDLAFDAEGKHVTYRARQGAKKLIVVDGQEQSPSPSQGEGGVRVGPNGVNQPSPMPLPGREGGAGRVAKVQKDGKWCVVLNGQEGKPYDAVEQIVVSPDGRRVAYAAGKGAYEHDNDDGQTVTDMRAWVVVMDGKEGPPCDYVCRDTVRFSPDGKHVACLCYRRDYGGFAVVDGRQGPVYGGVGQALCFSPDSSRLVYAARDSKHAKADFLVLDGQEGGAYDYIHDFPWDRPTFSPDSKRVAFVAKRGQRLLVVVDGFESPEYEAILIPGNYLFAGNGKVHFAALRDRRLLIVESTELPPPKPYEPTLLPTPLAPAPRLAATESVLAKEELKTLLPTAFFTDAYMSSDGRRMALAAVFLVPPRVVVVMDGQVSRKWEDVGGLVFSPDGKRFAYSGVSDGKHFLVVDGRESTPYDFVAEKTIAFSPDGKHLVCVVQEGGKYFILTDGQKGEPYDNVAPPIPVHSAHWSHAAYAAARGEEWFVVADGKEGPHYADVSAPIYSADGKHLAYSACRGETLFLVLDGKEGKPYDLVLRPVFSPDGQRVACAAMKGKQWMVVLDGQESAPYDKVEKDSLVFSPDGRRFAFVANKAKSDIAVVDGRESAPYDWIEDERILFSPDGKHVAYAARKDDKWRVVADGEEGTVYSHVAKPAFSPDGSRLAYKAEGRTKGYFMVVNGQEGLHRYAGIWGHAFSPDGKHLAWIAKNEGGKYVIAVDGRETGEYPDLHVEAGLVFDGGCVRFVTTERTKAALIELELASE